MGEVWRATDTVLSRSVAVKLLKSEYADDATSRARFEAEAQHTAQLHHPNIAAVFDFGEQTLDSGETTAYLVMELVEGQPLSALLRPGEPLAHDATARIIADAADAVQVAHDAGIVHRDIKPANLIVTPDGTVKVTDFGIARAGNGVPLTQTGQVVGTPHYLAPEQAEGRPATPASDVYAIGVVLYECLAGRRPFDASTPVAIALAHVRDQPPPLPDDVPAGLAAACVQAMAKDPAQRPESASALANAVRRPAPDPTATRVMGAPAAGMPFAVQEPPRRRPAWLLPALAAAGVVLLVVAAVGLASTLGQPSAGTPTDTGPSDTGPVDAPAPTQPSAAEQESPPPSPTPTEPSDKKEKDPKEDDKKSDDEKGDGEDDDKPGKGKGRGEGRTDDDDD